MQHCDDVHEQAPGIIVLRIPFYAGLGNFCLHCVSGIRIRNKTQIDSPSRLILTDEMWYDVYFPVSCLG